MMFVPIPHKVRRPTSSGSPQPPCRRRPGPISVLVGAFAALVVGGLTGSAAQAAPTPLVGVFAFAAGSCNGGRVNGSYFRMILQGGNANGPFLSNSDSTCSDQTYTPMSPGTDRGLQTGSYQPEPSPAFDGSGNSLANRIISPARFYGVAYSASTNPVDPQTGVRVPVPTVIAAGTTLSGDLQAVAVSWNNQRFNQGSPKPGGSSPGDTTPVTGTYDSGSGDFTLHWTSQVVGGPFNGFSGLWHLTGQFIAGHPTGAGGGVGALSASASASSSSGAATGGGSQAGVGGHAAGATTPHGVVPTPATATPGSGAPVSSTRGSDSSRAAATLTSRGVTHTGLHLTRFVVALIVAAGLLGLWGLLFFDRKLRAAGGNHTPIP